MKILIRGAKIVNSDKIFDADILINSGKIVRVKKGISDKADKIIDARGKYVFPGFVDIHTHLRTPGREDEEDILSGSKAAAHGGFTTICCMPNTDPCIDNEGLVRWIIDESKKIGIVDIYPVGAITKNREGKELSNFSAMAKAGCLALSDDGDSVKNSLLLRRALEYAKMCGLLIISHCEDKDLSAGGSIRESFVSSKYGIRAVSDISESVIVYRDIALAEYVGARLHLAHISSKRSIDIIRGAKKTFPQLSCETAPHYLTLTVEDVERNKFHGNFKVNPPLGEQYDLEAVRGALKEGTIDCIATDHAPHSPAEKELPFEQAPPGFIGLETAFSLAYTYLVKDGILDLRNITEKLSFNPVKILGLEKRGVIKEGFLADITIVDLEKEWTVEPKKILSKSKNTPFMGRSLKGTVEYTIHKGRIVYKND